MSSLEWTEGGRSLRTDVIFLVWAGRRPILSSHFDLPCLVTKIPRIASSGTGGTFTFRRVPSGKLFFERWSASLRVNFAAYVKSALSCVVKDTATDGIPSIVPSVA